MFFMNSANYFVNMNTWAFPLATVMLVGLSMLVAIYLQIKLAKRFSFFDKWSKPLTYVTVFTLLPGCIIAAEVVHTRISYGAVQDLFIVESDPTPRLTALVVESRISRGANWHKHRLMTFDLWDGRELARAELTGKHDHSSYRTTRADGRLAWGYSEATGIQILDLQSPRVIPALEVEERQPDLKREKLPERPRPQGVRWQYNSIPGSTGNTVHAPGVQPTDKSAVLLRFRSIPELCKDGWPGDRRWFTHHTTAFGESDLMLSYLNEAGERLQQINVDVHLGGKGARVLFTYTTSDCVYLFLGAGRHFSVRMLGYSLMALKTDRETGEILDEIHYL